MLVRVFYWCFIKVFIVGSTSFLIAQEVQFMSRDYHKKIWTTANGLPVNHAHELDEDAQGFIWICTVEGLIRFDGISFQVFNSENVGIFKSNAIQKIEPLRNENWVLSSDFFLYKYKNGVFYESGLPFKRVHGIWGDMKNNVLYLMEGRNFHVIKDGQVVYSKKQVFPLLGRITQNGFLFNSERKLYHYTLNKNNFIEIKLDFLTPKVIYSFYYDEIDHRYYIMDNNELMWINQYGKTSRFPELDHVIITNTETSSPRSLTFFRNGYYVQKQKSSYANRNIDRANELSKRAKYSETDNGVIAHTEQNLLINGKLFETFQTDLIDAIQDRRGIIWVATANGLIAYQQHKIRVLGKKNGMGNEAIYWIKQTVNGKIYAGSLTTDGYEFDGKRFFSKKVEGYTLSVVAEDGKGNIWGGSGKICLMTSIGGQDQVCADSPNNMEALNSFYRDQNGRFWLSYPGLLYQTSDLKMGWQKISDEQGKDLTGVYRMQDGLRGEVWFGTRSAGLYRFVAGKIKLFLSPDEPCGRGVREIVPESPTEIWLGTESNGICHIRFDSQGKVLKITKVSKENGLFKDGIHRIIDDKLGRFWMNTNYGIFWVLKKDLFAFVAGKSHWVPSVAYAEVQGMPNREGNGGKQDAGQLMKDGTLWFPTMEGIVVVNPRKISKDTMSGLTSYLVGIESRGKRIEPKEAVNLSSNTRDLTFHYSALSFEYPSNTLFRVRLEGYDEHWRTATALRSVNYTNLEKGEYTLYVQAGVGGKWGKSSIYSFRILPFWYETLWFRVGTFMFIIGLIYGGIKKRTSILSERAKELEYMVKMRTEEIKKQQKILEEKNIQLEGQTRKIIEQADQLKSLNEIKSRLFINVAHEIRTPLTVITEPIRIFLNKYEDKLSTSDIWLFKTALNNGNRVLELVNQILQIARLEAGMIQLDLHEFSIVSILKDWIYGNFKGMAEMKKIELRLDMPEHEIIAEVDIGKIHTILSNIIQNALNYSPANSIVTVSVKVFTKENTLQISVTDQGAGIKKEELAQIFSWYYRSPEHADSTGTGIGLSLSKELSKAMQGDLVVESERGVGSTFTLTLPIKIKSDETKVLSVTQVAQEQAGKEVKEESKAVSDHKPLILIVEDNEDIAGLLVHYFSDCYRVVSAKNGEEALLLAKSKLPDLVITDVMMPIMDGWQFIEKFRQFKVFRAIPVIVLTARADAEGFHQSVASGADAYIPKPFSVEAVALQVKNLLQLQAEIALNIQTHQILPSQEEATSKFTTDGHDDAMLEAFNAYVLGHLDQPDLDVNAIAEHLGMSRSVLFRRLSNLIHTSPKQYINRLRMEQAMKLLKAGVPVVQVTFAVGYQSHAGFSKAFKSHFGISPSEV